MNRILGTPHGMMEVASARGKLEDVFVEYASVPPLAEEPMDMHQIMRTGNMPAGVSHRKEVATSLSNLDIDPWLPFAAEYYRTSANLRDYVVVPYTIFLTDFPNANLAAFPFEEMSAWEPTQAAISYQTWRRKPAFQEHVNQDPTIASGLIFDSSMRRVPSLLGEPHRVVLLVGWDRHRYPQLVEKVISKRSGASMGAWIRNYSCSVCSASLRNGCEHIHPQQGPRMVQENGKLVYRIAHGVQGFEVSFVANPAWRSAWGIPIDGHLK
jgi:hypothetical protein